MWSRFMGSFLQNETKHNMTKIRFFLSTVLFVLCFSATSFAQRYKTAAGVRFDNGLNLTAQQYIKNGWTVEGILHTPFVSTKDFGLTVLGEKHHKILFRGINFYTGVGAHYYWQQSSVQENNAHVHNNVVGLSGIAGLEASLGRINVGVDWKPELHLSGDQARPFEWNSAAISVRYIIEKRERKKVNWKFWNKSDGNKKKNTKKKGKR